MRRLRWLACSCSWLCVTTAVFAQPVPSRDPSSTHIFPAGGRRGTVVPVRVGGECLPPGARFRIWGDGVSAPAVLGSKVRSRYELSPRRLPTEIPISYPTEWQGRIEIGADATPGPVLWRLTCAQGGTGARPFVIGDLPEIIETESNSRPEDADRIGLPVTVNGQIAGERDLDYYVFSATAGEVVVCDVAAARLGSPLDPVVELLDRRGRRLEFEEIRVGSDPVIAFRASATDEYLLLISNLSFHGGPDHVYRLTFSTSPYMRYAFPPGGRRGQSREVEFYALSGTGTPRVLREGVSIPRQESGDFWYRGSCCGRDQIAMNPVPMVAGELPDIVEEEENDSPDSAMRLALPVTVNGRFLVAADEDWFRFEARKDTLYALYCRPFPAGLSTLPIISLVDENGGVRGEVKSVDSARGDCRLEWRAPADGDYRIRVRDVQQGIKGAPSFIYRLTVQEAVPAFSLRVKSDFVHVLQGGESEIEVAVERSGGLEEVIELSAEELPPGVHLKPAGIPPDKESAKLTLKADEDARPTDVLLRVVGRATVGGKALERIATAPHLGVDADGVGVGSPVTDSLHLTVRHKPVFRLFCSEAYLYAHRGTVFPYPMELERLDGYDGEITLQIGDRQNRDLDGVEMFEITVPPGATEARMPIYLPETMHINVQSQSQLYVQGYAVFTDKWGERQSLLVVSEKRCMIRPMPTVVKLKTADGELIARAGGTVACRLELERTSNFPGPMDVELVAPLQGSGCAAEKLRFAAGQTSAVMKVRFSDEAVAEPDRSLRFRAVGKLPNDMTVISEASVAVRFE